jgi:hypothetical protein
MASVLLGVCIAGTIVIAAVVGGIQALRIFA